MDLVVAKEDLSMVDCGGGKREEYLAIAVDSSQSPRNQRQAYSTQ